MGWIILDFCVPRVIFREVECQRLIQFCERPKTPEEVRRGLREMLKRRSRMLGER